METVLLASDHAGFELKERVKTYLSHLGTFTIIDVGAHSLNSDDDYPRYMAEAALRVAQDGVRAILFGGSGQGEAMVANRTKGVRAAVYYGGPKDIVTLSRAHNDANILSLGARFLEADEACKVVSLWLRTPFEGGRHSRRIAMF